MHKFSYVSGGSREGARCNLYIPKTSTLKQFYYLGAKAWNNLPQRLRLINDPKIFSKVYKTQLLDSITEDPNYAVNNSFDYFYKITQLNLMHANDSMVSIAFCSSHN